MARDVHKPSPVTPPHAHWKNLKQGHIVKIYQDPITEEDFEGWAKLIKPVPDIDDPGVVYWEVTFTDLLGRGQKFARSIKKDGKNFISDCRLRSRLDRLFDKK
jgi:hypothetical protein